jgi:Ala-tRNA(Pro) deacylase
MSKNTRALPHRHRKPYAEHRELRSIVREWIQRESIMITTLTCKERLERYLREQHVPFEVQHHPLAVTALEVAEVEHVPGEEFAKVVMLIADQHNVMLVLPAAFRVDVDRLSEALAMQSVRLATEAEFAADFPDCQVGAMPPFGSLYGVDVYVDRSLTQQDNIVFRAGTHTDTMSMAYKDFAELVVPMVVDVSRRV